MTALSRTGKFAVVGILALLPTLVFVGQGIRDLRVTDAQIEAGAPEDTLGLGFWSVATPVSIAAIVLFVLLWRQAPAGMRRGIAIVEVVLFVGALVFEFLSYRMLAARVLR
jgi:uncharacterized BrkB/YihY/UPF0761 family membrane protein